MNEVDFINSTSQKFDIGTSAPIFHTHSAKKETNKTDINNNSGFCIRTGVKIPFNIEKPFCADSFREWNKYGNIGYPEKFCHFAKNQNKFLKIS